MGDGIGDAGERPLAAQPAADAVAVSQLSLSVVLDGRFDGEYSRQVARLVARLGLAGVWLRQPWPAGIIPSPASPDTALASLRDEMAPFPVGLVADADEVDAAILEALTQMNAESETPGGAGLAAATSVSGLRLALTGTAGGLARWQRWMAVQPSLPAAEIGVAVAEAGDPVQPGSAVPAFAAAVFVPFAEGRDLDAAVANAAMLAGGRPVWVEIAVSVGRTATEARARADTEELFALLGSPAQDGLFGTLEECQEAAARLAHVGATELVCYLPRSSDLPDVLAQLRAIAVGAGALRPGGPPSSPPPPPVGWGGRRPRA